MLTVTVLICFAFAIIPFILQRKLEMVFSLSPIPQLFSDGLNSSSASSGTFKSPPKGNVSLDSLELMETAVRIMAMAAMLLGMNLLRLNLSDQWKNLCDH